MFSIKIFIDERNIVKSSAKPNVGARALALNSRNREKKLFLQEGADKKEQRLMSFDPREENLNLKFEALMS